MMRTYALTYPQLMNQAREAGYSQDELQRLKSTHELAIYLFDGFYRAQKAPFVCHLIRTASIVMDENGSADTVLAALLHAAYSEGRWAGAGASQKNRERVAAAAGKKAEELIRAYAEFPWHGPSKYRKYIETVQQMSSAEREVLLVRLANELEDYMDLSMAYRGEFPYRETIENCGRWLIELAEKLGHMKLAAELTQAYCLHIDAVLPAEIKTGHRECHALESKRTRVFGFHKILKLAGK